MHCCVPGQSHSVPPHAASARSSVLATHLPLMRLKAQASETLHIWGPGQYTHPGLHSPPQGTWSRTQEGRPEPARESQ